MINIIFILLKYSHFFFLHARVTRVIGDLRFAPRATREIYFKKEC